jgi:hypothetical protein
MEADGAWPECESESLNAQQVRSICDAGFDSKFLEWKRQGANLPLLTCFYTAPTLPPACAPMPREPSPAIGTDYDSLFPQRYTEAVSLNAAIHDGAVIVGRNTSNERYRILGWSYRLFPNDLDMDAPPNMGSAFNSGLSMSRVAEVDFLYLSSSAGLWRFIQGQAVYLGSSAQFH